MRRSALIVCAVHTLAVGSLVAAAETARGGPQASGQTPAVQKAAPARRGAATPFTAKLMCPIPAAAKTPDVAQSVVWPVGPTPCDPRVLGEACKSLVMTQEHCRWEGMTLGGQALTESLMHGQGYLDGASGKATTGYDWGTVANGDSYLSRWTETIDFTAKKISGTWTLVLGTGTLKGITGQARIQCAMPAQTDTVEVCTVTGSYRLPR
jgi:hypothetical protein